jgi:hypothetical protein
MAAACRAGAVGGISIKEHRIALMAKPPLILSIWCRLIVQEGEVIAGCVMGAAYRAHAFVAGISIEEHRIALVAKPPRRLNRHRFPHCLLRTWSETPAFYISVDQHSILVQNKFSD